VTPTDPTPSAFVRALEAELRLRGEPFGLADLLAFAEAARPLMREDPDPGRWAREFIDSGRGVERLPAGGE
jgi:hypothetical protein